MSTDKLPNVVATAPKKIYLVIGEDTQPDTDFPRLVSAAGEDITWCEDKIDPNSIPYIRADLAAEADATVARLEAEVGLLRARLTEMCRVFPTDSDMDEAGWEPSEIEQACKAYDAAKAALAARSQEGA